MNLERINKHPRDGLITMDEPTHIYTIEGNNKGNISVTTLLKYFFKPFDSAKVIACMLKSKKMNDPEYEYYGMNAEQIQAKWTNAADLGTKMHEDIEYFYNGEERENNTPEYRYFKNYYNDNKHLVPYRTEWKIYHKEFKIAGSIDMVYIKENGHIIITDWKRSKNISFKSFDGDFGKHQVISHLPDSNYYHYSLQLNIYKYILEEEYDMIVDELYIVCCHPNASNYVCYQIQDLSYEVEVLINDFVSKNRVKK